MGMLKKAIGIAAAISGLGLAFELCRSWNAEERKRRALDRFLGYAKTPNEVVDSFIEHIRVESPKNLKSFLDRRQADPEAAMAETFVFGVLQQLQLNPTIADEVGIGGGDFLCRHYPLIFS